MLEILLFFNRQERQGGTDMKLTVSLKERSYPLTIEPGILDHLSDALDVSRKGVLLTDSGVPEKWVRLVQGQFSDLTLITVPQGEASKSFETLENVLQAMADARLSRKDCLVALGGGVVGDLGGLAASLYMRGIDFYNIPTTMLSQLDSSVGGKTAIDLGETKNLVGTFWQPKAVVIDPQVLSTLDERQMNAGLMEALKMGLILDPDLVDLFEAENLDLLSITAKAVDLKRQVVEQDEKEGSLRRILNFGHTIGHGIEGSFPHHDYLHGECVGMGMLYFLDDPDLKKRVIKIEQKLSQPVIPELDQEKVLDLVLHDKKSQGDTIYCIAVSEPGKYRIENLSAKEIAEKLKRNPYEE